MHQASVLLVAIYFRVAVRLALASAALGIDEAASSKNTHRQKHARLPDSGFVSWTGHAIVLKRIATGMRGVTAGVGL